MTRQEPFQGINYMAQDRAARDRMLTEQAEHSGQLHAECVSDPNGQFSTVAHTHEGQRGWWLFSSEIRPEETS